MEWRGRFYRSDASGTGTSHVVTLSPLLTIDTNPVAIQQLRVVVSSQGTPGRGTGTSCDKFFGGASITACTLFEVVIRRIG